MSRLRRLVFNFLSMDPLEVGGAARLGQCLARHVSEAADPAVECVVAVAHDSWARSFPLTGRFRIVEALGQSKPRMGETVERAFHAPSAGRRAVIALDHALRRRHRFPEAWGMDTVVHVPTQTIHPRPPKHWNLPYVMNLADIQHEHFPEFFTPKALAKRRKHFLASAQAAAAVCVADEWTRRDILAHLPLDPGKVHAIPLAPTWEGPAVRSAPLESLLPPEALPLPAAFAFYPAQTWAHKNHLRLFEALSLLRARGVEVPLVCTGRQNEHFPVLRAALERLGLQDQVRFLGLVDEGAIQGLYQQARVVVVPTLFEGGPGIPVLEALALGRPLAASTACGIPEAVEDAGLLFDPMDPGQMAAAIGRLWNDPDLAADLGERGRKRMAQRTWARTAAAYLEVYEAVLDEAARRRGR